MTRIITNNRLHVTHVGPKGKRIPLFPGPNLVSDEQAGILEKDVHFQNALKAKNAKGEAAIEWTAPTGKKAQAVASPQARAKGGTSQAPAMTDKDLILAIAELSNYDQLKALEADDTKSEKVREAASTRLRHILEQDKNTPPA